MVLYSDTYPHVVKGDPHPVAEVLAEERDLGVALAEVVQHDELSVHPHADADGLGGSAVREHGAESQRCTASSLKLELKSCRGKLTMGILLFYRT